jgi:hypothetical protein
MISKFDQCEKKEKAIDEIPKCFENYGYVFENYKTMQLHISLI